MEIIVKKTNELTKAEVDEIQKMIDAFRGE